jgi:surface protein
MSVRFLNNNSSNNTDVVAKTFSNNLFLKPLTWVRNPSWPACEANSGDNRVRGLYAVWPSGGNFIAMTVAGAYTVNYGDGTTTNYGTGVQANYEYNYNDADLVGTEAPVTFTDSTDTVNRTAHGYTNGMKVQFFNITTTTGIVNAQFYFVINATADTFQVSATSGGSAIALTNDGTGQLLPYRIATVTITPQGGSNLTSINLFIKHNQTGLVDGYSTGWLDLAFASSTITSLTIGASTLTTVRHNYIERVRLNELGAITTFVQLFANLLELQNVVINANTATVTSTNNMFRNCNNLQTVPLFDTSSVTDMTTMFGLCPNLQTVPLFNTASATVMQSMFTGCLNLQTVPLFNTASVTNMQQMFENCFSLQIVPLFNTSALINMFYMFNSCPSLKTVPLFNTASVTNMSYCFLNCSSLETVPLFNTVSVQTMSFMFRSCSALETISLFNTANVTDMSSMFSNCHNLKEIPLFNTVSATNMSSMFQNCYNLQTVPLLNTSSATNMSAMFNGCTSLQTLPLFNTPLNASWNSFVSDSTSIQTVPLFNTVSATNMSSMFSGCFNLQTVPLFNTASVTNMSFMFNSCRSLSSVPALTTTAVDSATNFNSMFASCASLTKIEAKNFRFNFSVANNKLSAVALNEIYTNLPTPSTPQTITISGNYGVDGAVGKSVNTTALSKTVPMADTSNLVVGDFVTGTGTGITTGVTTATDVTANTFTLTNHGLTNGKRVSFTNLSGTTGISNWTIYFVVSATANTFQVALTDGGSAIDLTGSNQSVNTRYPSYITAITLNVSVTLDTPAATNQTGTNLSFRTLDSSTALLKRWSIIF